MAGQIRGRLTACEINVPGVIFFPLEPKKQKKRKKITPDLRLSFCEQGKLLFSSFLTKNEGTTDESKKTFGMLSAGAI